jgi:hypothetical protein
MLYSVSCSPFFGMESASSSGAHLQGDLAIAFTCDPANKDALVAAALEALEVAQREGPSQQEVDTLRCGRRGGREGVGVGRDGASRK